MNRWRAALKPHRAAVDSKQVARAAQPGEPGRTPGRPDAPAPDLSAGIPAGVARTGDAIDHQLLGSSGRDLRAILDNISDAVSVKGHDRRYRLVNSTFEQRFGLQRGEIDGCRDDVVLPAEMLEAERESDERVLRTGESVQREDVGDLDGEARVYVTIKFALRGESGDVCGLCTLSTDITERRRREDERRERAACSAQIHDALVQDRLVLHGQPIVDLIDGQIVQTELLVRMIEPQGSLISPGAFLPAAERFGLVAPIDLWVMARGLELATHHRVEINLSGKTISAPEYAAQIERLVAASGAPPQNIIFEITETAVVEKLDAARRFADRLRAIGCSFALDDFGVGFGTFTYLKHLPVDYLKIDIEFVRNLLTDPIDRHVVGAMVAVADGFGIKTIAEGVEDQGTLELLKSMGVDYAQGYFTGRPAPISELWPQISDEARIK